MPAPRSNQRPAIAVHLDEELVDRWFAALGGGQLPETLRSRWQQALTAAVRNAGEPPPAQVTGRYAALDRYVIGVAAGVAAARATSDTGGATTDSVILAAGLLAGSAALQISGSERSERVVAADAAAAVVDAAAAGHSLDAVIGIATRAARRVRGRPLVGVLLQALGRAVDPEPGPGGAGTVFDIALTLEPTPPETELDVFGLDAAIRQRGATCDWIPTRAGFQMLLRSTDPGPLIEAIWSFGELSGLLIELGSDQAER